MIQDQVLLKERNVVTRQKMKEAFQKLLEGIERNLSDKNRDKFAQNFHSFRTTLRHIM